MSKIITHASLFSGIGGPEVAAAMLGWKNAFHCEINPFGRSVLEYWFPESVSYEDITKTNFEQWRGRIDVLTGGFPCQPFSYAGRRGGREDERYLWPQMLRAINEIRPTWVVGENVAGITTMVEGGVCSEMGSESSLFGEGDGVHRYELQQAFTIERICRDLERLGYSVQPVLIPAAAVGAPHRRDRIFILAHDADTHCGDDLRKPGEDAGEGGEERLQERNEVREPGEPDNVRRDATNTASRGRREVPPQVCAWVSDGNIPVRDGGERIVADANCPGREEPVQPGRRTHSKEIGTGLDDRTERSGGNGNTTGHDRPDYGQGARWADFPTVSPIHRGNDGLPFPLDNLTISPSRWRTESLKAYGNAIVPQVMYEIFLAIEKVTSEVNV